MELVILAAGMGSRFGGLKQLEPIDDNNNFIIDYSVFDAIRCGYDKVVFIIKKENLDIFKSTIGNRISNFVDVKYVFQDNSNIPEEYYIPADRKKPFGTTHALLCATKEINDGFTVINADDFYGLDAFQTAAEFLKKDKNPNKHALIAYQAANTVGENGNVKRGICDVVDGKITGITESVIDKCGDGLVAVPLEYPDFPPQVIPNDTPVSMNMFSFKENFKYHLQTSFSKFLEANKNDLSKCESLLPTTVTEFINSGDIEVDMLPTTATWYGITYKEDKPAVQASLKALVDAGEYPSNLWANMKIKD